MVEISNKNNNKVVRVSVGGSTGNNPTITPNGDYSSYYSELSKAWAIKMDGMVSREDYSSKYYSTQAKANAETTENNLNSVISEHEQITNEITEARENISGDLAGALTDIATARDEGVSKVTETKTNSLSEIESAKTEAEQTIATGLNDFNANAKTKSDSLQSQFDSAMADITLNKEQSMSAIDENRTTSVEEILANKTSSMNAIDKNRTDSLSEIENAKTSALENITTTESSAISNIEQTGTEEYDKIISTGIDAKLSKNIITNCLLEVPQRIKLALENGKMHLYKGSVLTYGDGTNLTIEEDVIEDQLVNTTHDGLILVYDIQRTDNKFGIYIQGGNVFSQDTQPTTTIADSIWFDTANNKMMQTHDKGATWYEIPLPIGIVSVTPNVWKSLDQVFNGMGYVGNTFWVDKGLKGLIANGRNDDGTLKNIEITRSALSFFSANYSGTFVVQFNETNVTVIIKSGYHEAETDFDFPSGWTVWYKPSDNIFYLKNVGDTSSKWTPQYLCNNTATVVYGTNGIIMSMSIAQPINLSNDYLQKTGGTMTGQLSVRNSNLANRDDSILLQAVNIELETTPSVNSYSRITLADKNVKRFGAVEISQTTAGENNMSLSVKHRTKNEYAVLKVGYDRNGNPISYAPVSLGVGSIVTNDVIYRSGTNIRNRFGTGFLIQAGCALGLTNNSGRHITFPIAYQHGCRVVTGSDSSSYTNLISIANQSLTGFDIFNRRAYGNGQDTINGSWVAVGF